MANETIDKVLNTLEEWAKQLDVSTSLYGLYTFGSLVDDEGEDFYRDKSDIDLILIFSDSPKDALERARLCRNFRESKAALEVDLMRVLQRKEGDKPIVSTVLVTKNEVVWDIHKSNNPLFFRNNYLSKGFKSLLENRELPDPNGFPERESLWGFVQAFSEVQAYRHKYLAISANQNPSNEIYWDNTQLIMKSLKRCAAYVEYLEEDRKPPDNNFKCIINGKSYLSSLLRSKISSLRRYSSSGFEDKLHEWERLQKKFDREQPNSENLNHRFTGFDLLLLYEFLFDRVYELFSNALNTASESPANTDKVPSLVSSCASLPYLQKINSHENLHVEFSLEPPTDLDETCNNIKLMELAHRAIIEASSNPSNDILDFFKKIDQLIHQKVEAMGSLTCMKSYQQSKADRKSKAEQLYKMVAASLPQDYESFKRESKRFSRCHRNDLILLGSEKILNKIENKIDFIKVSLEKFAPTEELSNCQEHYQALSAAVKKMKDVTDDIKILGSSGLDAEKLNSSLNDLEFHTQKFSESLKGILTRYLGCILSS